MFDKIKKLWENYLFKMHQKKLKEIQSLKIDECTGGYKLKGCQHPLTREHPLEMKVKKYQIVLDADMKMVEVIINDEGTTIHVYDKDARRIVRYIWPPNI